MQQTFYHGRLIANPFNQSYALGPNLDIADKADNAYEKAFAEEPDPIQKNGALKAQRNFLCDLVYFLYENNRVAEAGKWYKILGEKFPDKTILENDPTSLPKNLTLDEYAVARVQSEVGDTSQPRMTAVVQGLLRNSYSSLVLGQDDRYEGFKLLAGKVYQHYVSKTSGHGNEERVKLPPFAALNRTVLNDLLDPQNGMPFAARAVLRTQLGMTAETNVPPAISTNIPPAVTTNAVEKISTNYVPVNPAAPAQP
jgi:hypothetical protein